MLIARVSVSVPQVDVRTLGIVVYITSQVRFVEQLTGQVGCCALHLELSVRQVWSLGPAWRQLLEQLETI